MGTILVNGALVAGAIVTITPLIWMLSASLMQPGEAAGFPPPFLPEAPTIEHYRALFTRLAIGRYALNSALIALLITAISLLFNSMAGYAFAKLEFRARDRLFTVLLAGLVIPVQIAMPPLFLLMRELGLVNTYWGVIAPTMATIFGIFLVRQYALSIPDELLEAARMDGAGEARIFFQVVLPLIRPILVTLAIFTFMTAWNDFMWPLIILTDQDLHTLPVALANLSGEHVQDIELMMAGSVLTTLPVLVLFLVAQRYYIEGITAGSLKD
ncbi:MAG: carbohydrate ABC transporter permease [Longimicrobiales bacterium]